MTGKGNRAMRGLRVLWGLLLAVALSSVVTAPALAFDGTLPGGRVVFGEDFDLPAGETLDGDLIVFGGNVELGEGSRVEGTVVVWGGNVDAGGVIEEDLAVFGGDVDLLGTAVVQGDLAALGGLVNREEGAEVWGQEVANGGEMQWWGPMVWGFPVGPFVVGDARFPFLRGAIWAILRLVGTTVLMAGLAGLVAVLWPRPAVRVGRASLLSPLPTFGMGLLTVVVIVALLVSICLSILGIIAAVAAGVAAVFGWVALGVLIGERLFGSRPVNPFWSAALGAGLLTLLSGLLKLVPCVGWIGGFLIACVGLGAVVLTRFGAVDYPPLEQEPTS